MITRIRNEKMPITIEATDRDLFNQASASGKTVKQHFIDKEMSAKGGEVNLYDAKMGLSKRFTDGVEGYYATNAFEVLDVTPNMPLSNFYYQSVMPLRFGGGFAEGIGAFRVNLAMAKGRLAGGNTNEVNVVGVDREKLWVPTYTIKLGLILGDIDWLKAKQINYDLLGLHTEALRLSYQRELEYFTMVGNEGLPNISDVRKGLLNMTSNDILEIHDLETTPFNGMKKWEEFDLNDWVEFVIGKLTQHLVAVQFDRTKAINLIAVPTALFAIWSKAAVVGAIGGANGTGVVTSIREYLLREINYRLNATVQIVEIPYLDVDVIADKTTARIKANGTNSNGRMVFMRSDETVIRTHVPLPLTGGQLAWSPTEDAYRQNHTAVISVPLVLYPETLFYVDNGITATEEIPEGLFTLTLPTPDNGTITSNLSALTDVPSGKLVRLTIAPASTYEVDTFTVNGVDRSGDIGEDGTYVFRIFADTVVTLTFKQ
mgnify:CR=1 FL=1